MLWYQKRNVTVTRETTHAGVVQWIFATYEASRVIVSKTVR